MKLAQIGRILLGFVYICGGLFNLTITTSILARNPALYSTWVAQPLIPFYKTLFTKIVTPNALPLTVLVALYELVIGGLILSRGRLVKIGLVGGVIFNVLIAPMWIGQAIFNLILVVLHLPLFKYDFPLFLSQSRIKQ